MHASRRLILTGLLIFGLVGVIGWAWRSAQPRRLNLLVITLDTTRADRLGAWGGPAGLTPVLDALAVEGTVFERAYAPIPLTLPSHASLMTGLYPPEHGLRLHNGASRLAPDIPVLAELLQQDGYATGAFIGAFVLDRRFGLDRGFDQYDDDMGSVAPGRLADPHDHRSRDGQKVVDAALNWLEDGSGTPFFCWVHLFDPHSPYRAREEIFGPQFHDRPYDAGIAYADLQVKRLLEHLRENGLDDHTVVVVAGDHGESLGEHQERTHGFTLYEATQHVPLILKLPESSAAGTGRSSRGRVSTPVSLVDVFPTLLEVFERPEAIQCSGRSLLPALRDEEFPAAPVYTETDHPVEEGGWAGQRSVIAEQWKYIRSPRPELYDLAADPRELNNLAEARASDMERLETALHEMEQGFELSEAPQLAISRDARLTLASLGYVGGVAASTSGGSTPDADIKDMLPHYNTYSDAQGLMATGEFQQARELLEGVVSAAPRFFQAWYNLGVCRQQLNLLDESQQAFERCVEIDGNPWGRIALSKVYLIREQPQKAVEQLEAATRVQSDSVEGWFLLGEAHRMSGDVPAARRSYQQALALDPGFPPAEQQLQAIDQQRD